MVLPCSEETPRFWDAFERMLASAFELDPRPDQKILHRARHQDLRRPSKGGNSSRDVQGQTADVGAAHVNLTRVHTQPDLDTQRTRAGKVAVEVRGVEPLTSAVRRQRSTTELHPRSWQA
jgi:hypothetical protein